MGIARGSGIAVAFAVVRCCNLAARTIVRISIICLYDCIIMQLDLKGKEMLKQREFQELFLNNIVSGSTRKHNAVRSTLDTRFSLQTCLAFHYQLDQHKSYFLPKWLCDIH